jgi:hypothetical protein
VRNDNGIVNSKECILFSGRVQNRNDTIFWLLSAYFLLVLRPCKVNYLFLVPARTYIKPPVCTFDIQIFDYWRHHLGVWSSHDRCLHARSRPTCALPELAMVSTRVSQPVTSVGVHQDCRPERIIKNFIEIVDSACYHLLGVWSGVRYQISKSSVSLMYFAISYRTRNRIFSLCGLKHGTVQWEIFSGAKFRRIACWALLALQKKF